ncbi:hypothetical protein DPEC_G00152590, partial [Dallia pectoralis]
MMKPRVELFDFFHNSKSSTHKSYCPNGQPEAPSTGPQPGNPSATSGGMGHRALFALERARVPAALPALRPPYCLESRAFTS